MPSHPVLAHSSKDALKIYQELGELTEKELLELHHLYTPVRREGYLRSIYSYHAGAIARGVYDRWAATHTCKACEQASKEV